MHHQYLTGAIICYLVLVNQKYYINGVGYSIVSNTLILFIFWCCLMCCKYSFQPWFCHHFGMNFRTCPLWGSCPKIWISLDLNWSLWCGLVWTKLHRSFSQFVLLKKSFILWQSCTLLHSLEPVWLFKLEMRIFFVIFTLIV